MRTLDPDTDREGDREITREPLLREHFSDLPKARNVWNADKPAEWLEYMHFNPGLTLRDIRIQISHQRKGEKWEAGKVRLATASKRGGCATRLGESST